MRLETLPAGAGQIAAHFELSGAIPARATLNLALVQANARSTVSRGENAGRVLEHANVVREWSSVALDGRKRGDVQMPLPADLGDGARVIGYVQTQPGLEIIAATSCSIRGQVLGSRGERDS